MADSKDELEVIPVLNNILLYQDNNELCEYCAIGPNDIDKLRHLPPWEKALLKRNIYVAMDITASRHFWWTGRSFMFTVPSEPTSQDNIKVHTTTNYELLGRIVSSQNSEFMQGEDWEHFIQAIKCLPYAQDLIL